MPSLKRNLGQVKVHREYLDISTFRQTFSFSGKGNIYWSWLCYICNCPFVHDLCIWCIVMYKEIRNLFVQNFTSFPRHGQVYFFPQVNAKQLKARLTFWNASVDYTGNKGKLGHMAGYGSSSKQKRGEKTKNCFIFLHCITIFVQSWQVTWNSPWCRQTEYCRKPKVYCMNIVNPTPPTFLRSGNNERVSQCARLSSHRI